MPNPSDPHWFSEVEAPRVVSDAADIGWEASADVVVLGYGLAGVSAALAALEQGASVIAVDRGVAGASAAGDGLLYAGGGTDWQQANGFDDSPEAMTQDLHACVGDSVPLPRLQAFCNGSRDLLDWLESHGVEFSETLAEVTAALPPRRHYLGFTGCEGIADAGALAPRGHVVFARGNPGRALFSRLHGSACRAGLVLREQQRGLRLVTDESGAVLGIELLGFVSGSSAARRHRLLCQLLARLPVGFPAAWRVTLEASRQRLEQDEATVLCRVRVQRGLVIASGGYSSNGAMLAPVQDIAALQPRCPGDGSGIRLAQSVGGAATKLACCHLLRLMPPALLEGVCVDLGGDPVALSPGDVGTLGDRLLRQHDGRALLVLDRRLHREALAQCLPWGPWGLRVLPALRALLLARSAASPEALAHRCGVSEEGLAASLAVRNRAAATSGGTGLHQGPWYGIDLSLDSRAWPCGLVSAGHLNVDAGGGAVCDAAGNGIPGLYAAGVAASPLANAPGVPGLVTAAALFSGRAAGSEAARASRATAAE